MREDVTTEAEIRVMQVQGEGFRQLLEVAKVRGCPRATLQLARGP